MIDNKLLKVHAPAAGGGAFPGIGMENRGDHSAGAALCPAAIFLNALRYSR
jgi:hypothetical protein